MMRGRIWSESEPGKGSRFHCTARFPRALESDCPEIPSPSQALKDLAALATAVEALPRLVSPADSSVRTGASGPASPEFFTPLSILLAEDNPVNKKVAVRLLEKRGHSVVTAVNGIEAVAAFERQPFDAVLMDVQMPEMDGLEAAGEIRARERHTLARIRIIAITAHAMPGDRERCLKAGMDDYILKPIQPAELFAAIERQAKTCASLA
jgi:CheY-like chemotaxis protein